MARIFLVFVRDLWKMESEVNARSSRQDGDRGSDICGVEDNFEVGGESWVLVSSMPIVKLQ